MSEKLVKLWKISDKRSGGRLRPADCPEAGHLRGGQGLYSHPAFRSLGREKIEGSRPVASSLNLSLKLRKYYRESQTLCNITGSPKTYVTLQGVPKLM